MDIQTRDGIILRGIPDGTPEEAIKARIAKIRAEGGQQQTARAPETPQPQTTAGGVASEVGKGLLRGPSDVAMAMGRAGSQMVLGPFVGPMASRGMEALAAPSRRMVQASPATPTERFAGTAAELGAAGLTGGGAGSVPAAIGTGLMALGGATGEQMGGDTGKLLGSLAPLALSPAASLTGVGLRAGRNVIDPWLPGGTKRAAVRTAGGAAGPDRAAIAAELRKQQQLVPGSAPTAGEAAAPVGRAEFSGLQEIVKGRAPTEYARNADAQAAARINALRWGGDQPAIRAAEQARTAETAPMRATAIENANIEGQIAPVLERRIAERGALASGAAGDVRRLEGAAQTAEDVAHSGRMRLDSGVPPIPGLPRVPERYGYGTELANIGRRKSAEAADVSLQRGAERRFAEMQLSSLGQHGYSTLSGQRVANQIQGVVSRPGLRSSDVVTKALGEIRNKILQFTDERGFIDARDIYTIRKEAGNTIKKFAEEQKNWDQRLTAGLEKDVQRFIDNAIESAGGTGWRDYLATYARHSRGIDQMKIGQLLREKLMTPLSEAEGPTKQRAAVYAQALRDEMGTTKAATGRESLFADVLEPAQIGSARNVERDVARAARHETLARAGTEKARDLVGQISPKVPAAGMFNPKYSVLRAISNRLAGKIEGKSLDELARLMQSGNVKELGDALSKMPLQQRGALVKALREARGPVYAGGVAAYEQ